MKKVFLLICNFLCSYTLITSVAYGKTSLPKVENGKPLPSNLFIELNKTVNPAVVNISTETNPKLRQQPYFNKRKSPNFNNDPMEELFQQFFGLHGRNMDLFKPQPVKSLGTGFIIRKDGLILTNSHVIDKADVITIQLSEKDDKSYPATVIGKDPKTDVALIKINADKNLPTVKLGSSSNLQVGEWVAAFGNPFGHGHSMSKGIVSAIGRNLDEINLFPFIQTDASINPGNSGGPLVNVKGEVIGVNTAIDARAQGIGFAIPIDEVKTIISQLEKTGSVSRGFLGVEMRTMNEQIATDLGVSQTDGAIIINVVPESAAARAGLRPYDIIVKINNKTIKTSSDLAKHISRTPIGKTVVVHIIRDKRNKKINVILGNSVADTAPNKNTSPPSYSKRELSDGLFTKYGFSVANITTKIKKRYEIETTGKHKTYVSRVLGYSKASSAGLREGDIIYEINRRSIFSAKDAKRLLSGKGKAKSYLIRIKRGSTFSLIRLET